jgi:5-(carboxyamino)imidazole ribonucleotide mutase
MPGGIPVATMAIGKAGAKNGAIFAIQILSLKHPALKKKLALYKKRLAAEISRKSRQLAKNLQRAR